MKLLEFFDITEPDMLLEAAKDRYMQMLPDTTIAKFFDLVEFIDPKYIDSSIWKSPDDAKKTWAVEVNWAVQTLKRADRIMWYMRYAKILILQEMLYAREFHISALEKDAHGFKRMQNEQKVIEARNGQDALSKLITREVMKLQQKTDQAKEQIAKNSKEELERRLRALSDAEADYQSLQNNNTRSRLTNAREAQEKAYHFHDAIKRGTQSVSDVSTLTAPGGSMSIAERKTNLEHFMAIPDARIQQYEWGFTPYGILHHIFGFWEHEWVMKQDRVISHDDESWKGAEKIIEFDDGRAWWNLHKSACEREGRAMGHCGNSYRSHRPVEILSLRESVEDGWKVLLTFIWNTENGMVEESKAFDNQKPDQKYHPYILELLAQPFIKGLAQEGTHKPENNFHLSDLDDETLKELQENNPQLVGATRMDEFLKLYDNKPDKQYEDGHGWYRSGGDMGAMDNKFLVYAEPFQSRRGDDYVMIKLTMSFGTHGNISNISKGDGSKPGPEMKSVIVDALLLDGPKYFQPMRHTQDSFTFEDLTREEMLKLGKLKPSYIGAKTQEELAQNGYDEVIIKYPDSAWIADEMDDDGEWNALYVKNFQDVKGQNYFLVVINCAFSGKAVFGLSYAPLYRKAFTDASHNKPDKEHHDVIKDLLNSKYVDAIKRFSDHSQAFHPDDFDHEEWDAMRQAKPSLGGLAYMVRKEGMSERMLNVINSELNDSDVSLGPLKMEDYDEKTKSFRVDGMAPHIFIDNHVYSSDSRDSTTTEQLYKHFSEHTDMFELYDYPEPDSDEAISMLEYFQKQHPEDYKRLAKDLWEQIWSEGEVEDDYGNFSLEGMSNPTALYDFIRNEGLDVKDAFQQAHRSGLERGAENDAYESFEHFWEHLDGKDVVDKYGDSPAGHIFFTVTPGPDAPNCGWCEGARISVWYSIEHIAESLEQEHEYDTEEWLDTDNWKVEGVDYPYHGWYGYDQEAANEIFAEEVWNYM